MAIGKLRKDWIKEGIEMYLKRLPGLTITEVRESNPKKEAEAIRAKLKRNELLVALSEEGKPISSILLSERLKEFGLKNLAFIIGGTEGLDSTIKTSADLLLSLSPMTFPHDLARLLLVEQIYRAISISQNAPYHR